MCIHDDKAEVSTKGDIAIIGIACRLPGAENYDQFWENLKNGQSNIGEIPIGRWNWQEFWGDPHKEQNKSGNRWGGFIDNVEAFDADFFGIAPGEAGLMDPQQRIMLELSWSCMEDAGICPSHLSGKNVGVYIGVANFDYKELHEKYPIEAQYATSVAASVIPNRISYFYNFRGPSIPIDTACASSLTAIHYAIQALRYGECSMALAGGVSVLLTPHRYICFSQMGLLGSSGICRSFDDASDGVIRGEGAGLLLLKPLEKALIDGNSVYGVIKGSAINHNGRTYTLTYPNSAAQAEVITEACQHAGISLATLSYIETHGTGTPKGDAMELEGLLTAFQNYSEQEKTALPNYFCGLGSAKTNIGHLEPAAGIAGIIKVLLSMQHKQLPGLTSFNKLNHRVSLQNSPFYIVDKLTNWNCIKSADGTEVPRRAGVSAFGFGGANAHIVMEEPPGNTTLSQESLPCYLICLSAKTVGALKKKVRELLEWVENRGKDEALLNISATLLLGREHFEIREAFVVKDIKQLQDELKDWLQSGADKPSFRERTVWRDQYVKSLFTEFCQTLIANLTVNRQNEQDYKIKLTALAELYIKGYDLEWKKIYPEKIIRLLNMPVYPFEKDFFWLSETTSQSSNKQVSVQNIAVHKEKEQREGSGEVSEYRQLQRYLCELVAELLKIPAEKISKDKDLRQYGMDSLNVMKLINRLQESLEEKITIQTVFENPTISDLTQYLYGKSGSAVKASCKHSNKIFNLSYFKTIVEQLAEGRITPQEVVYREKQLLKQGDCE